MQVVRAWELALVVMGLRVVQRVVEGMVVLTAAVARVGVVEETEGGMEEEDAVGVEGKSSFLLIPLLCLTAV